MDARDIKTIAAAVAVRAMRPLVNRVNNMFMRILVDSVNDGTMLQTLKAFGLSDDALEDIEHMQPGGLTHVPLSGAEGVGAAIGGGREHVIALGVSNRNARPTGLAAGETGLYNVSLGESGGLKIKLLANGDVLITPSHKTRIVGDLEVTGEITAMADSTPVKLSTHKHPSAMGPTGAPIPEP